MEENRKSKFLYKVNRQEINKYESDKKYFKQPRLVDFYEYNYESITKAKRIKYFIMPKTRQYPIDLNEGSAEYVPRNNAMYTNSIEVVLKYDVSSATDGDAAENEKTKVFTRRGALVRLMEIYYTKYKDQILHIRVSRYNNNLYIVKDEVGDTLDMGSAHHAILQQKSFADSPDAEPDTNQPFDENIMLIGVHQSTFGKYNMIYCGEIQGIMDDKIVTDFDDIDELSARQFVHIKQMWKKLKTNENKILKYWLQSYLANVRKNFFGYKTGTGTINEPLECILTKDLVQNRFFKPHICTGFLYSFLQNVEKVMSSVNCLNTVYLFHYNPRESTFTYDVFKGKTDKSFISKEYMQFCQDRFDN